MVDELVAEIGDEGPSSPLGSLLDGELTRLLGDLGAGPVLDQLDEVVTGSGIVDRLDEVLPDGAAGLVEGTVLWEHSYNGTELDAASDGVSDYARRPGGKLALVDPDGAGSAAGQAWVGSNPHSDVLWTYDPGAGLTGTSIYGPFGTRAGSTSQPLAASRAGFQGDWTDPVSGQVWMGARWYRPSSGTFTARDTYEGELTSPVTRNRYLYGNGSPLRMWDADGRCASQPEGVCAKQNAAYHRRQARSNLSSLASEKTSYAQPRQVNWRVRDGAAAEREAAQRRTDALRAARGVDAHQLIISSRPPDSDCDLHAEMTGSLRSTAVDAGFSCRSYTMRSSNLQVAPETLAGFAAGTAVGGLCAAGVTLLALGTFGAAAVGYLGCGSLSSVAAGAASDAVAGERITARSVGENAAIGAAFGGAGLVGRQLGRAFSGLRTSRAAPAPTVSGGSQTGRQLAEAGRRAEDYVSDLIGVPRNVGPQRATLPGSGSGGYRVPDFDPQLTGGNIHEVKDVARLSITAQIRDLAEHARSQGTKLVIHVRDGTHVPRSGELQELMEQRVIQIERHLW